MHCIYIIRCGNTDFYKIGLTSDVNSRLAALQCASPFLLSLVKCFPTHAAMQVERVAHEKCEINHVRGEWFEFSPHALENLMRWLDAFIQKSNLENAPREYKEKVLSEHMEELTIASAEELVEQVLAKLTRRFQSPGDIRKSFASSSRPDVDIVQRVLDDLVTEGRVESVRTAKAAKYRLNPYPELASDEFDVEIVN